MELELELELGFDELCCLCLLCYLCWFAGRARSTKALPRGTRCHDSTLFAPPKSGFGLAGFRARSC